MSKVEMRRQRAMQMHDTVSSQRTVENVERAAGQAISDLDLAKASIFEPISAEQDSNIVADPWQFIVALQNSKVIFPLPSTDLVGAQIAVVSRDGYPIQIKCSDAQSKVCGSIAITMTEQVARYFICDGRAWW